MMDQGEVLRDVSERLTGARIPFMVTGSTAMNYYAQPRMTRDIDVIVHITKRDVTRMLSLFGDAYYISEEAVWEAVDDNSMFNIIHTESIVKVDFIMLKSDLFHREAFARKKLIKIDDYETYLIGKEDLILSKMQWAKDSGSEVQRDDIKNLLASGYDAAYVSSWIKKLGLEKFFAELLPD